MAEEREMTRKEMAEALDRAAALIAEQGKQIASLMATPVAVQSVPQPGPQKVAYKGLVRTKEPCFLDHLRQADEIFEHEVDCLWSDDPFEPVVLDVLGRPQANPQAPKPVPFHLRPRSDAAMAARAATPQTASQW